MDLPLWFRRFLSPEADRSAELARALEEGGVRARAIELAGGRFVAAWPKGGTRDRRYRVKVVTAHHDRVPGTPGALDNSAACLQLVEFLTSGHGAFNTLVVFTDNEELGAAAGAEPGFLQAGARHGREPGVQGSFEFGRRFFGKVADGKIADGKVADGKIADGSCAGGKVADGLRLRAPMVFPLDVTGRGDSLVLSTAACDLASRKGRGVHGEAAPGGAGYGDQSGDQPRGLSGRRDVVTAMAAGTEAMAETVARMMAGRARVFRAAVPFGEDLGFMLAGVPALEVTVLPRAEAEALAETGGLPAWAFPSPPGFRTPATWSRLHGPDDTPSLYTADAFELMARFLERLGALRVPAPVPGFAPGA